MDSSLAPAGASSLMIQAMAPPRWLDNWGGGDRAAYETLKDRVKNVLIGKASALIPELRKHIVVEDAATPLTYERYTHNTDGASSAWSWNPRKRFYKSLLSSNVRTPIKNLFIGSCWATQLGGIPGAVSAALNCVKKIGP
jgi:phytoene dehydrogenase-like protein